MLCCYETTKYSTFLKCFSSTSHSWLAPPTPHSPAPTSKHYFENRGSSEVLYKFLFETNISKARQGEGKGKHTTATASTTTATMITKNNKNNNNNQQANDQNDFFFFFVQEVEGKVGYISK